MTSVDDGFKLEVRDDTILATFAGTSFSVVYRKPTEGFVLKPTGFSKDVGATPGQIGAFLSIASQLATEKARTLGWIK